MSSKKSKLKLNIFKGRKKLNVFQTSSYEDEPSSTSLGSEFVRPLKLAHRKSLADRVMEEIAESKQTKPKEKQHPTSTPFLTKIGRNYNLDSSVCVSPIPQRKKFDGNENKTSHNKTSILPQKGDTEDVHCINNNTSALVEHMTNFQVKINALAELQKNYEESYSNNSHTKINSAKTFSKSHNRKEKYTPFLTEEICTFSLPIRTFQKNAATSSDSLEHISKSLNVNKKGINSLRQTATDVQKFNSKTSATNEGNPRSDLLKSIAQSSRQFLIPTSPLFKSPNKEINSITPVSNKRFLRSNSKWNMKIPDKNLTLNFEADDVTPEPLMASKKINRRSRKSCVNVSKVCLFKNRSCSNNSEKREYAVSSRLKETDGVGKTEKQLQTSIKELMRNEIIPKSSRATGSNTSLRNLSCSNNSKKNEYVMSSRLNEKASTCKTEKQLQKSIEVLMDNKIKSRSSRERANESNTSSSSNLSCSDNSAEEEYVVSPRFKQKTGIGKTKKQLETSIEKLMENEVIPRSYQDGATERNLSSSNNLSCSDNSAQEDYVVSSRLKQKTGIGKNKKQLETSIEKLVGNEVIPRSYQDGATERNLSSSNNLSCSDNSAQEEHVVSSRIKQKTGIGKSKKQLETSIEKLMGNEVIPSSSQDRANEGNSSLSMNLSCSNNSAKEECVVSSQLKQKASIGKLKKQLESSIKKPTYASTSRKIFAELEQIYPEASKDVNAKPDKQKLRKQQLNDSPIEPKRKLRNATKVINYQEIDTRNFQKLLEANKRRNQHYKKSATPTSPIRSERHTIDTIQNNRKTKPLKSDKSNIDIKQNQRKAVHISIYPQDVIQSSKNNKLKVNHLDDISNERKSELDIDEQPIVTVYSNRLSKPVNLREYNANIPRKEMKTNLIGGEEHPTETTLCKTKIKSVSLKKSDAKFTRSQRNTKPIRLEEQTSDTIRKEHPSKAIELEEQPTAAIRSKGKSNPNSRSKSKTKRNASNDDTDATCSKKKHKHINSAENHEDVALSGRRAIPNRMKKQPAVATRNRRQTKLNSLR